MYVLSKNTKYFADQKVTLSNHWVPKYKHIKYRLRTGLKTQNPTKHASSAKNRKSWSVKHDIIYAFCEVIKTETYL